MPDDRSDATAHATRIPMCGGDEYDALTRARKMYFWAPGARKAIKRGYWRRFRAAVRRGLRGLDHG